MSLKTKFRIRIKIKEMGNTNKTIKYKMYNSSSNKITIIIIFRRNNKRNKKKGTEILTIYHKNCMKIIN